MTEFRILQLTDLHLLSNPESTVMGIPTRLTLQDVVETILQRESEFDHVIVTGDHTHDERPESYDAVRRILKPWRDRLAVVPGNHDDRDVMRTMLGDVIGQQNPGDIDGDDRITFMLHYGSWLLVGLDTHVPGQVSGRLGEAQAAWLHERLAVHGDRPCILFCHHPTVDVGSDWMDAIGLTDRDLLVDVVRDHPSVRLICCGHVHHEFEGYSGKTRVVTTPSTGLQFRPEGTPSRFADDPPGYRVIELYENQLETYVARLPHVEHTPLCD
ncbi:MAG: phosphodiesterase [Fuerstiella sp.]|nr:phosphodiesterase [Fuerstiella sp.]